MQNKCRTSAEQQGVSVFSKQNDVGSRNRTIRRVEGLDSDGKIGENEVRCLRMKMRHVLQNKMGDL